MSKIIETGCHGIVVNLIDLEPHALTPNRYGGGSITSDLHEEEPERKQAHSESELSNVWNEFLDEKSKIDLYNAMIDALESMILAHAQAGIDITTPAYLEGIETACQACAKETE